MRAASALPLFTAYVLQPLEDGFLEVRTTSFQAEMWLAVSAEGSRDKCARVLGSFSAHTLHVTDQGTDPQ